MSLGLHLKKISTKGVLPPSLPRGPAPCTPVEDTPHPTMSPSPAVRKFPGENNDMYRVFKIISSSSLLVVDGVLVLLVHSFCFYCHTVDGGYGDDARDTVQSFEHKVLWIIHLHQNDLSLNQRALSMAMTWYFHLATGSMLAPSLSTSTTLCHSLVSLLTVKNFEFSTSLLKLVLGSLLDAQKSGECGDLLQAVAYQQFIWPLYSILKCTRSTMVMKELVASSR